MTYREITSDDGDWLAIQHAATLADLAGGLDVHAGLQEVLITSRHRAVLHDVAASLDVEAGLRAILPCAPIPQPAAIEQSSSEPSTALPAMTKTDAVPLQPTPPGAHTSHVGRLGGVRRWLALVTLMAAMVFTAVATPFVDRISESPVTAQTNPVSAQAYPASPEMTAGATPVPVMAPAPVVIPAPPVMPPVAPMPTLAPDPVSEYLDSLSPSTGWWASNGLIVINGTIYPHALVQDVSGCSSPHTVEYNLNKGYRRLVAKAGLGDDSPDLSLKVQLTIFGDGKELSTTTVVSGTSDPINVDVVGVLRLRFEFQPIAGANCMDNGDDLFAVGTAGLLAW
jgi:NPCBM/NEW2 domain